MKLSNIESRECPNGVVFSSRRGACSPSQPQQHNQTMIMYEVGVEFL